jgi:hypothetical protein
MLLAKMLLAFRAICGWCCCAWPRACRRCAFTPPASVPVPAVLARESLQVFAPLANRLGIWQIKWEMEDLAFRFLEPDDLPEVARLLDEKRAEREAAWHRGARRAAGGELRRRRASAPGAGPAQAHLQHRGRRCGQGARLRPGVRHARPAGHGADVPDCYAALSWVHERASRRCRASSTTTSPSPSPTATSRCTPWCATSRASHRSRSAPRPCTSMPSTAWPRTGPTRRPAPRAMPA